MVRDINTYYDNYSLLSLSPNSIVMRLSKEAIYDPVNRNETSMAEHYVLKVVLDDKTNGEDLLTNIIENDTDLLAHIAKSDIEIITNYHTPFVGRVNVLNLVKKLDGQVILPEHQEVLNRIPNNSQDKLVLCYPMHEYANVDENNKSIYERYVNADGTLNKQLFENDFARINEGLHALHTFGIAHHDLKPSAFMFANGYVTNIKLTDLESSVLIDEKGYPKVKHLMDGNIEIYYAKRLLSHSKYHQDINALYDVDKLGRIQATSRLNNINLDSLSIRDDCDLVRADYFSLGMTLLDIFMYRSQICNFNTFTSILATRFKNEKDIYKQEALVVAEIRRLLLHLNTKDVQREDPIFYDTYLKQFGANGPFSRVGMIINELINENYGYEELKNDLDVDLDSSSTLNLLSILKNRLPEVYNTLFRAYRDENVLESNLKRICENDGQTNFASFKNILNRTLADFFTIPQNEIEFRKLNSKNFKSLFLEVIDFINDNSYRINQNVYAAIMNNTDLLLYFTYFMLVESRRI